MSERLWAKDLPLDEAIHRFTVGDDPATDLHILPFDCLGSAAHVRGLAYSGILSVTDARLLLNELEELFTATQKRELEITVEQEDGHTALESELIRRLGEPAKNVHLGRSRNDQVATAMRLWMRDATFRIANQIHVVASSALSLAEANHDTPMPGYTHLRRAMPSSFGQWFASLAEGLAEELEALTGLLRRFDRCPLGGAAGFGVPLPLDREYVAKALGFSRVHISPIDVQNSRGRHELAATRTLASVGLVLERFLGDLALYSTEEFGFVALPDAFTTGSSIMPQKRNPDVIELARARCRELGGFAATVERLSSGLSSSYHRDFQLLKKPTIEAFLSLSATLDVVARALPNVVIQAERAAAAMSDDLYAAQAAYDRALSGEAPFRDAYKSVGKEILDGTFTRPNSAPKAHLGSPGNLGIEVIRHELDSAFDQSEIERERIEATTSKLWDTSTLSDKT